MIDRGALENLRSCTVYYRGQLVGRLEQGNEQSLVFQYDVDYLNTGSSISPILLPLQLNLFEAAPTPFEGNFGVFDDSLPDGWGSLILDRFLRKEGINPSALSPIQHLSLMGASARGALEYRPDYSISRELRPVDFSQLVEQVQSIYESLDYDEEAIDTVFRYSGSAGGARPKIFVKADGADWLVKFAAHIDPCNVGIQEYDYSLLAAQCGIAMAETRLFEGKYFATKRFDRGPEGKIHTISAAGLLQADYRIPSLDYQILLVACQRISKDLREVEKLFRLMVFNVCIGNRDDHAKNFSFQLQDDRWTNSPAYDLLPSYGFNGQHTTTINGKGHPERADLLSCGKRAGLDLDVMNSIIDQVAQTCVQAKMFHRDLRC